MTALKDLVTSKNVVAFEVANQKVDTVGKSHTDLQQAVMFLAVQAINADDGHLDTLSDTVGKKVEVKVYLEKDGVKAEDTYTVEFK